MKTEDLKCFLCKVPIEKQIQLLSLKEYQLAIRGGYRFNKSYPNLKQPNIKGENGIINLKQEDKNKLKELIQLEKELTKNRVQICTTCRKKIDKHINQIV
ncbi:MAG: hypothetical protein HeimC3_00500 [Candidatus Heimdallarchaeota archaeon LC_3]|nr:MAG: hypothetical protein HeimC3_00500 [Candidatus Heimdallarchaeota archaeon LC_3]